MQIELVLIGITKTTNSKYDICASIIHNTMITFIGCLRRDYYNAAEGQEDIFLSNKLNGDTRTDTVTDSRVRGCLLEGVKI